jgi:probable HAF family extracellular repeat protein
LDGGQIASSATGISADGQVIVGTGHSTFGSEAFRFDNPDGPLQGLGFLPDGISSKALGVSADGNTIVGRSVTFDATGGEAFRWTQTGGMIGLGDLDGGAFESVAYAASSNGSVIVGSGTTDAGTEAFRWLNGGMTSLGDLPGGPTNSVARAVSANGARVVGEGHTAAANSVAFVWDPVNGLRNLRSVLVTDFGLASELAGWDLLSATGISGDGSVIVGSGINPDGDLEAWRAELDAVPMLPGDYNDDGNVDAADYVVWRKNPEVFGGNPGGYNTWRANFGNSLGSGSISVATVPEPASGWLLAIGVALAAWRGHRFFRLKLRAHLRENSNASRPPCVFASTLPHLVAISQQILIVRHGAT